MTLCSIHFTLWRIAVGFTGFFRHIKRIETIWKHVYDDDLVSQHCKVFHQCSLFMYWKMICSIDSTLVCLKSAYYIIEFHNHIFPQIASAIGVLTSRIGVRVRRFVGFVLGGGLSGRVSFEVSFDVCMGEGWQILIRFGRGSSTQIRKGVLNQHVGIQPTASEYLL